MKIKERIRNSWSINTTYCPNEWTQDNPAWGQCAVTSILLQELYGGRLMKGWVSGKDWTTRHYWIAIKGIDVDMTWEQFPEGVVLKHVEEATIEDLITDSWMKERYNNLNYSFNKIYFAGKEE